MRTLVVELNKDSTNLFLIRKEGMQIKEESDEEEFIKEVKKIKDVRIVLDTDGIFHKVVELPRISKRYLKEMLKIEIEKEIEGDFSFLYEEIRKDGKGSTSPATFFVIAIEKETLIKVEDILRKYKLSPRIITTYPAVVRSFALQKKIEYPVCFIDFGENRMRITILKEGMIRIYRNIKKSSEEDMRSSIRQTLLFYLQENPMKPIQAAFISGKKEKGNFLEELSNELGIEVRKIEELGPKEVPLSVLGALAHNEKVFNFCYPKIVDKKRRKYSLLIFSALLLTLISNHLMNYIEYKRDFKSLSDYEEKLEETLMMRESQLSGYVNEFIRYKIEREEPPLFLSLLEIASIKPDGIRLSQLRIYRESGKWVCQATGIAEKKPQIEALKLIEELRKRMKRSPFFFNPSVEVSHEGKSITFELRFVLPEGRYFIL